MAAISPRVVVVTRETEYESLLARHATRGQVEFFLKERGQTIEKVEQRHQLQQDAVSRVMIAIPVDWRRNQVKRHELDRFLFEPDDLVVTVGQDGLVANTAKYLSGQHVIGVNPDPAYFDGILVPFSSIDIDRILEPAMHGDIELQQRTMVKVYLDNGQSLLALNELFIGHRTHQSARYEIHTATADEFHSSSGVIVATGTGATGWAQSIHRERHDKVRLPTPEENRLAFYVREAFPSKVTGTSLTSGLIGKGDEFSIRSKNNDGGVIFGDGIEGDYLPFNWGMEAKFSIAPDTLALAMPGTVSQQRVA